MTAATAIIFCDQIFSYYIFSYLYKPTLENLFYKMANILSISNVTGTPVPTPATGAPATLITYALGENNYQAIEIKAMLLLTTTASSTPQTIIVELKFGGVVLENFVKTITAAVTETYIQLDWMARINGKGNLTVTLRANGGTADANTNITVQNTYILGHY